MDGPLLEFGSTDLGMGVMHERNAHNFSLDLAYYKGFQPEGRRLWLQFGATLKHHFDMKL